MSVAYLLLDGQDCFIGGIITPDGYHVFSIYEFLEKILIGNRNRTYVKKLWDILCNQNSQFMHVQGTLDMAVRSTKMPKREPTAGTTVAGLRGVLDVLGRNHVTDANRKVLEDIFARYATGDRSMIVEVDLNAQVHQQIPRFSYNLQPPTASAQEPVASVLIEEADAGAAEPTSSRESSMEFDLTSTQDHVVRTGA
jgi:hypothetical protein